MTDWLDRFSLDSVSWVKTAGLMKPPPVMMDRGMEIISREALHRYGDVKAMIYSMRQSMEMIVSSIRRIGGNPESGGLKEFISTMEEFIHRGRPEDISGILNRISQMEGSSRGDSAMLYLLDFSKSVLINFLETLKKNDMYHVLNKEYDMGTLDTSGWEYEEDMIRMGRRHPERLYEIEKERRLKMKFALYNRSSGGSFSPEKTTITIYLMPQSKEEEDYEDNLRNTLEHEIIHYAQSCMNYMLTENFTPLGQAGSGGRMGRKDYIEEANDPSLSEEERARYHAISDSEFWPNLRSAIDLAKVEWKHLDSGERKKMLEALSHIGDATPPSQKAEDYQKFFGMHHLPLRKKKIVMNEVLKLIRNLGEDIK